MALTVHHGQPTSIPERAAALCDFLADLQQLRTTSTRSIESYRSVLWYADLPETPQIAWPSGDEPDNAIAWLSVDRTEHGEPPRPPGVVEPWLPEQELWNYRRAAPRLSEAAEIAEEIVHDTGDITVEYRTHRLSDRPEVEAPYRRWLPTWQQWAALELARAPLVEIYQCLYAMYQDLTENPQLYEFVLSFGYLTCRSDGYEVKRHLVTVPAGVALDSETGRLTVTAGAETGQPRLEEDMLDETDRVREPERRAVLGMLDVDGPLWGTQSIVQPALERWTNGTSLFARYRATADPQQEVNDYPIVSHAPALVLRKRDNRPFIEAYRQIRRAIETTGDVPDGFRRLVEISDTPLDLDPVHENAPSANDEVYFPEPANEDQRQVVQRLRRQSTVLVQGPPGTGKTHTIANLVTHLLAEGQRVLVTSHTTRALRVLRDKLPSEVQDLCVRLTDDRPSARDDLEQSVQSIQDKLAQWSSGSLRRQLAGERRDEEERRAEARRRQAEALHELREIRAREQRAVTGDGDYRGTPQQIAERLRAQEDELGWLGPVDGPEMTVDPRDAQEFLRLLRAVTPELRGRTGVVPADDLAPDEFAALAERIRLAQGRAHATGEIAESELFRALTTCLLDQRRWLDTASRDAMRIHDELHTRGEPWLAKAVDDVRMGRDRLWRERHALTMHALSRAEQWLPALQGHTVTGLDGIHLGVALEQANLLRQRLVAGKKLSGRAVKEARGLLDAARIDGRRVDALASLDVLGAQLNVEQAIGIVEHEWSITPARGQSAALRVARLRDETAPLGRLLQLADAVHALRTHSARVAGMPALNWSSPQTWALVARCLDAIRDYELKRDVESQLDPVVRSLRLTASTPGAVPAVRAMLAAVECLDVEAYLRAHLELRQARQANELIDGLARARTRVAMGHARLAEAIETTPNDPRWEERLPRLAEAWAWAAMDGHLRGMCEANDQRHWRGVLSEAEVEIRHCQRRLAANLGWAACLGRLTQRHAYHLSGYAGAVRKIGKGTGKYAPKFQAQARYHLTRCQEAVPAWIMPLHRVAESVSFEEPHVFDVAIIDEASQSGLEALLLHWLARRVLVVGDDRQISPSDIGINFDAVFRLQRKHLRGLPNADLYGPVTSMFEVANQLTFGGRLMLREHFRCMPEIIEFSNRLCYQGKLLPLRQFAADRLKPVLTTYVPAATITGRGQGQVNRAEVEALVEQVDKCCKDPVYDGKTMGVITLLGSRQQAEIRGLLLERLGVAEVEARQLNVGNAEDFQGAERDVIFLSMVSAPEGDEGPRRVVALTKESDERRFNVATSRARDQLWLFHSVRTEELSSTDLRRRLLEHCLAPWRDDAELGIGPVSPDVRQAPFESLLEQRVYLALRERGYRVRPQYNVAGRRIDLVVEGSAQRLAIECDGDAFHGPDTEEDDALRQLELERLGWTFWRVRGSTFFRDPRAALEPLWDTLESIGIEPLDLPDHTDESRTSDSILPDLPPQPATSLEPPHQPAPEIEPVQRRSMSIRDDSRLSARAFERVRAEVLAIKRWLADPPPLPEVIGRAEAHALRTGREREERRLNERLQGLQRVLHTGHPDVDYPGGYRVGPGCIVEVRYDGEDEPHRYEITTMDSEDAETLSPDSPLARALQNKEEGDVVSYVLPDGRSLTARVAAIED